MSYLVLTRKEGDKVKLRAEPGTDAQDLLAQLLLDGITLTVKHIEGNRVQIGIEAPEDLRIMRGELEEQ